MKKIYALLMLCLPMLGFAQKDVTFIVDMRDYSAGHRIQLLTSMVILTVGAVAVIQCRIQKEILFGP